MGVVSIIPDCFSVIGLDRGKQNEAPGARKKHASGKGPSVVMILG